MVEKNPNYPVRSIERIFRKDMLRNEFIATMRVELGFKSTHVPDKVKFGYAIMDCKYYIPKRETMF